MRELDPDALAKTSLEDENALAKLENAAAAAAMKMKTLQVDAGLTPSIAIDTLLATVRAKVLTLRIDENLSEAQKRMALDEMMKAAQAIVDSAEEQIANAEAKRDGEKKALAAEAERLMKFGVTFGVGLTVQIPLLHSNGRLARLEAPQAGVMPYLLFMPAFWGGSASKRAYCAAEWSASQAAAVAAAEEKQNQDRRALRERIANGEGERDELEGTLKENEEFRDKLEQKLKGTEEACKELRKKAEGKDASVQDRDNAKECVEELEAGFTKWDTLKEEIEDQKAELEELDKQLRDNRAALRELNVAAFNRSCWKHKYLGFYAGYPATFDATTTVPQGTFDDEQRREVRPIISFGYAMAPNALIAALAGATVGTVKRDDESDATFWALTVGLGGNADLLSLLR